MNETIAIARAWHFSKRERTWLWVSFVVILLFGANLEKRTALRRVPMTDLSVPVCAAGAVVHGDYLYNMTEWHNYHYNYPPTLAILLVPLAHPVPTPPRELLPGEVRTDANTPWGYDIETHKHWYGLRKDNARFFVIIAVWYVLSIVLIAFSAHALACALEGCSFSDAPPLDTGQRRRWWAVRTLPLLVCAGSLGTDLSRGQMDILMMSTMCFGLYAAAKGREFSGGMWLSFPAAVKLFPGLIFLYPAWRLKWRMTAGVAAGLVLALAVLPGIAFGPTRTVEYYKTWLQVIGKPGFGQGADKTRAAELTAMNGTDNQSCLAFLHNWRFHDKPRGERPPDAVAIDRKAVYLVGAIMLASLISVMGMRQGDSPRDLLISVGLLMGLALVVSPVTHNYYYLFLLPLVTALVDYAGGDGMGRGVRRNFIIVLVVFSVTDLFARLPGIGPWLRDAGMPFLSMVAMMVAGAVVLRQGRDNPLISRTDANLRDRELIGVN
jgi:hypothetical protein